MHVFYLHGFASSPESSKATFFRDRFAACGVAMHCPDFNQPDFSTLTVSRMLTQLDARIAALPPGDVVLVGSSLGGFVAIEAAARHREDSRHPVARLILLAPAVELEWDKWTELQPGGVDGWKRRGSIEVFHYAYEQPRALGFDFYLDAERYRPALRLVSQPIVIFQGRQDESVTPATVAAFAGSQPDVRLHMVEDGHQLKNSLEFIWAESARVLAIGPSRL